MILVVVVMLMMTAMDSQAAELKRAEAEIQSLAAEESRLRTTLKVWRAPLCAWALLLHP